MRVQRVLAVLVAVVALGVALLGNLVVGFIKIDSAQHRAIAWAAFAVLAVLSIYLDVIRKQAELQRPDVEPSKSKVRQAEDRVGYLAGLTADRTSRVSSKDSQAVRRELADAQHELTLLRRRLAALQDESATRSSPSDSGGRPRPAGSRPQSHFHGSIPRTRRRSAVLRVASSSICFIFYGMAFGIIYVIFEHFAGDGSGGGAFGWAALTPAAIVALPVLAMIVSYHLFMSDGTSFVLMELALYVTFTLLFLCGVVADFAIIGLTTESVNVTVVAHQISATAVEPIVMWIMSMVLSRTGVASRRQARRRAEEEFLKEMRGDQEDVRGSPPTGYRRTLDPAYPPDAAELIRRFEEESGYF